MTMPALGGYKIIVLNHERTIKRWMDYVKALDYEKDPDTALANLLNHWDDANYEAEEKAR